MKTYRFKLVVCRVPGNEKRLPSVPNIFPSNEVFGVVAKIKP